MPDPLAEAFREFNDGLGERADDPHARLARALVQVAAGHFDGSEPELAMLADELPLPGGDLARIGRVRALRALGSTEEALAVARSLLARHAHVVSIHTDIAACLLELGRGDEAHAWLVRGLAAFAGRRERVRIAAVLCALLKREQRPAEGVTVCDELLADPSTRHPGLLANRGDFLIQLGRWDDAARDLDEALRLDPTIAAAHANRGLVDLVRGDVEPARRHLRRAVALDDSLRPVIQAWWDHDHRGEAL